NSPSSMLRETSAASTMAASTAIAGPAASADGPLGLTRVGRKTQRRRHIVRSIATVFRPPAEPKTTKPGENLQSAETLSDPIGRGIQNQGQPQKRAAASSGAPVARPKD